MAIAAPASTAQTPGRAVDPFRFGWRYVRRELPDGEEVFEQVPLTLHDVHYPQEEDFIVHSDDHERIRGYLYDALSARLAGDPSTVVLTDVRVAWATPAVKPLGPDVIVLTGVRSRRNWSTFNVGEEGAQPALVIEITSPETRRIDAIDKVDEYETAGVGQYIIIECTPRADQVRHTVRGFRMTAAGYVPAPTNPQGWIWLDAPRVWIGVQDNTVLLFEQTGVPIGDYVQIDARRREAEARAEQEAQARAAAEARLRELQQELDRLRSSPKKPDRPHPGS